MRVRCLKPILNRKVIRIRRSHDGLCGRKEDKIHQRSELESIIQLRRAFAGSEHECCMIDVKVHVGLSDGLGEGDVYA